METNKSNAGGSSPSSAPAVGGFSFNFEKTKEVPPARSYAGKPKYDWGSFPAPTKNAKGEFEYANALIEKASRKTLNTSINKFLKKPEGKDMEFTTRQEKDPKTGTVIGIRVYRVK